MLTINGPKDYYSPYPTMTSMRGSIPGLPADATSQKLAVYYRKLAKELGVKLRPRPAGATLGQSQVLDALEAIELSGAYLSKISSRLFRQTVSGGAMCSDLNRYNAMALKVYEDQRDLLQALRDGGVKGIPLDPPWPPLFIGVGSYTAAPAESLWTINCDDKKIVTVATGDKPNGVRIMMAKDCQQALGAAATAVVVAVVITTGLIAHAIGKWFEASVDIARIREESRRKLEGLKAFNAREAIIDRRKDECVATGRDYFKCLKAAHDSVWDMDDMEVLDEFSHTIDPGGGRSWLWWVGLAAVIGGGVVAYKMVKRRRAKPRRMGPSKARVIDV